MTSWNTVYWITFNYRNSYCKPLISIEKENKDPKILCGALLCLCRLIYEEYFFEGREKCHHWSERKEEGGEV